MEVPTIAQAIEAYLAIAPLHKEGSEEVIKARCRWKIGGTLR